MKRFYKYIMLFVAAIALVSCSDNLDDSTTPSTDVKAEVKAGDEVQFGLSLEKTRTVYGAESGGVYPIYWVDGDKVKIYSPQANSEKNSAEYKVVLPDGVDKPNYAKDLIKIGEYGVQWGEGDTYTDDNKVVHTGVHDFYSIYPSDNCTFEETDEGVVLAKNLRVSNYQSVVFDGNTNDNNYKGFTHDMSNSLMWAYTPKVDMQDGLVDLQYTPISTVIEFALSVTNENLNNGTEQDFVIMGATLQTDDASSIAGTFSVNADDGTYYEAGAVGYDNIAISFRGEDGRYTLKHGQEMKFPVFLAPAPDLDINGWTITINTNQGTFKKTLDFKQVAGKSTVLEPGKIHKIKLPVLSPTEEGWDKTTWMRYLPRNVYLSEVSIPGTWNSLNIDCQLTTDIKEQYALGVRAFHIDTRWKSSNTPSNGFLGFVKTPPTGMELSVATGGSGKTNSYGGGNLMKPDATTFKTYLNTIVDKVQPDEYMVVFCTFAHNSYDGEEKPSTWFEAVSDACELNDYIYDASQITENTVVGDVLGHVIVIVNLPDAISTSSTLPADSKCMFTNIPMNLPQNHYAATTNHNDNLWSSTDVVADTGIKLYNSHAQISTTNTNAVNCSDRGYSHPLTNRDELVKSIWDWAKTNYTTTTTTYAHNAWIYLGLGGYILNSSGGSGSGYDTIENRYGPMIYDRINAMKGTPEAPYYPVGILLMNNKKGGNYTKDSSDLGYGFEGVCEKVLMLNNLYELQFDPDWTPDTNPGDQGDDKTEGGF